MSTLVSSAKYDLFVSYARADNLGTGWVRALVELLQNKVATLLPRDPQLYFDERIEIGTNVPQDLLEGVNASRILLVVLSPRYLASPWCRTELERFLGRSRTAARSVFVIEAERIDRVKWPEELRATQTVALWERDPESKVPARLDPKLGSDYESRFFRRVYEICYFVAERLNGDDDHPRPSKGAVWIAEATDDLVAQRENLAGAVRQAGWDVLPRSSHYQRHDPDVYRASVDQDLAEARLFVQLLGPWGGQRPDWCDSQFPVLQAIAARTAAERQRVRSLRWRSKDAALSTDVAEYCALLQAGDVQESTPGEFTAEVLRCLAALSEPPPSPTPPDRPTDKTKSDERVIVYVHSDEVDRPLADEIQRSLLTLDVDSIATPPPGEQLPSEIRKGQLLPLESCDGVILVYGSTPVTWVQAQFALIRKAYATVRPAGTIGLLTGPPPKVEGLPIASRVVLTLKCDAGLEVALLADFVARVREQHLGSAGRA